MAAPGQELPVHGGRGGEAQDAPVGVPLTHADVLSGQTPHAAHRLLLGFFNFNVVSVIQIHKTYKMNIETGIFFNKILDGDKFRHTF